MFSRLLQNKCGFSLIELIAVLALMGIVGLMAGLGISQLVDGFIYTRDVADNTGKGQLTMLRLSDEMRKIKEVNSGTATSLNFVAVHGVGVNQSYTVSWDGISGHDMMMSDGTNNDILIDEVKNLKFQYYPSFDGVGVTTWTTTSKIIEISITLTNSAGIDSTFITRIVPRNI